MYIVEKMKVDRTGRIQISRLFEEIPEEVVPIFDTESRKLIFAVAEEGGSQLNKRKADSKGRVCLPRWMIDSLGEGFFLTTDSLEEHCLLPEKFFPAC